MHGFFWGLLIVFSILVIIWVYGICVTQYRRGSYYKLAVKRANAIDKPLIVIGDPSKGMSCKLFGCPYGFGDVCIDLEPLNTDRVIQADVLEYLRGIADDSAVIFISCVLEYIPGDLDPIINEIYRVAGNYRNIFIVTIPWYNVLNRTLYFGFQGDKDHNIIFTAPPVSEKIQYWTYS